MTVIFEYSVFDENRKYINYMFLKLSVNFNIYIGAKMANLMAEPFRLFLSFFSFIFFCFDVLAIIMHL